MGAPGGARLSVAPAAGTALPEIPAGGWRTFLVLWSTQTLSLFGTYVSYFAVTIWLTRELYATPAQKAALALALTATAVANTAPTIVLMPLAGAFADRHDRRRTMLVANLAGTALSFALMALLLAGRLTLWPAVALLVGYAIANAFHSAAFDSSFGLLVPPAQLQRASAMMQTSFALSQVTGPALAALLIGLPALARDHAWPLPSLAALRSGVPFAFAADGVSFVVATVALLWVRLPERDAHAPRRAQSLFHDVWDGVRWVTGRPPFLWLISLGSIANFTLAPLMLLLPLLVRDRLAADLALRHVGYEAGLAMASTAAGLGGILGGVLVSAWGGLQRRRVLGMAAALLALGAGQVVAGLATTLPWLLAGLFGGYLFIPFLNSTSYALWQSLTPHELIARALATRRFVAQSFFPIGSMVAGWLAVPVEPWILVAASGAALALFAASQLLSPRFATLEDRMREAAAR